MTWQLFLPGILLEYSVLLVHPRAVSPISKDPTIPGMISLLAAAAGIRTRCTASRDVHDAGIEVSFLSMIVEALREHQGEISKRRVLLRPCISAARMC